MEVVRARILRAANLMVPYHGCLAAALPRSVGYLPLLCLNYREQILCQVGGRQAFGKLPVDWAQKRSRHLPIGHLFCAYPKHLTRG